MKTTTFETMSVSELHGRFKNFGARGMQLCGRTADGQPLGAAVKKFFDDLVVSTTDPEQIKGRAEFLARAQEDPLTRKQFAGIRIETLNNYILATINVLPMFYEVVNLADDERPVVQNTTDQEISVNYVGADGGVKMTKVVKDDDEALINLHYLTTDKVRYRRVDIYRGTIIDAALKTLKMAYDMKNQMDARAFTLLQTAFGTFRYYGDASSALPKKTNYTYLPNKRIKVANLPTSNDIVMGDNTSNTSLRISVLRAARKYANQWQGAFPEGDLLLTGRILVPGLDAADISDEIVPSGSSRNKVADELMENGWARINYLGVDYQIINDNTLDPKYCYFEFNRKPGRVYLKPSQDRENVWGENDYNLSQNNEEERWSQKVFGAYLPSNLRMNVLRIKYRT